MPPDETSPLLSESEPIRYNDDITVNGDHGVVTDEENGTVKRNVSEQDPDVPTILGVRLAAVIPAMAIGIFLAAMDNTIVVASYGRIGTELNELNRTSWLSTAYVLHRC